MTTTNEEKAGAPMESPNSGSADGQVSDEELGSLEAPIWVKLAAGSLGMAAVFSLLVGFQITSLFTWVDTLMDVAVMAYFVGGVGAGIGGALLAKGYPLGAYLGIASALAIGIFVIIPITRGFLAATIFFAAGFSGLGLVLAAISIPSCLMLAKRRAAWAKAMT